jgi:uncharacterized protein
MNPHISVITLGVKDVSRAKQFYGEGLGWPIGQDYGGWVTFGFGDGTSAIGLYPWDDLAGDAGVAPDSSGFRGLTFSYIVSSDDRVAAVLFEAEKAGGTIVKPVESAEWGGCSGFFADPDGYLWKVASGPGPQPYAAE